MTALIERLKSTIQSDATPEDAVIARMNKLEVERKRADQLPKRPMFH